MARADRADHGATAIDLTLVSSSLYGEAEWETSSELWGSDHLPISLLLRGVQLREDSVARVTYNYSNADCNGFQHLLATAVYPSPTDNIEIWYEDLRDVILQAAEVDNDSAHTLTIEGLDTIEDTGGWGDIRGVKAIALKPIPADPSWLHPSTGHCPRLQSQGGHQPFGVHSWLACPAMCTRRDQRA
ncbi:hypothetical protein ACOMHN_015135 [Nucella lapillus]